MNPIICLAGPTASGKTALAVELAKEFDGEVVSCDSMQVYRRMDIGTAKPTKEEMQGIPHHMIDVASPEEDYSVSRYCRGHGAVYGFAHPGQRLCAVPIHRCPAAPGGPGGCGRAGGYGRLAALR